MLQLIFPRRKRRRKKDFCRDFDHLLRVVRTLALPEIRMVQKFADRRAFRRLADEAAFHDVDDERVVTLDPFRRKLDLVSIMRKNYYLY
jgi:hypothetical protein